MNIRMTLTGLVAAGLLQGCGLAETTVAAGAAGGAAGEQAKEARETMENVRSDVADAQAVAAKSLAEAEAASQ